MSVLAQGDYLESMVTIVNYDTQDTKTYEEYVQRLDALRRIGCTITPKAVIPEPGIMWLYGPTEDDIIIDRSEVRHLFKSKAFQATTVQLISSLFTMYHAGYDFVFGDHDRLEDLIDIILMTDQNIAVSADVKFFGWVTVFHTPYCMISSDSFTKPIITEGMGTYACLRLIPYLILTRYRSSISIGGHTLNPDSLTYQKQQLLDGTMHNVTKDIYQDYAYNALRFVISQLPDLNNRSIGGSGIMMDMTGIIFASQESIVVFD